ncbi:uncharacterized protein LOC134288926 [Aedes albopictus]|uniref:Ubiquitin-like protease family profile domain-containing protein n=1 Tax=Aedes albopictus TaxID=7160 RepID=A0ABM1ZJD4_AEDAL
MKTFKITEQQKERFVQHCSSTYGPHWMTKQFEAIIFKDKIAFKELGLSMQKHRLSKNILRISMLLSDERKRFVLRNETDERNEGRMATMGVPDGGTAAGDEADQQQETSLDNRNLDNHSTFKLSGSVTEQTMEENNLPESSKHEIETCLKENIGLDNVRNRNIYRYNLLNSYLQQFRDLPDFQLFDVQSISKDVKILGIDFKSFFGKEWLFAGAVDIGMKSQCSKFQMFDYLSLNIYETRVLLGGVKGTVDKSLIANIINRDIVFCPIFENNHFSLFVIDFRHAVLYYLDSGNKSVEQLTKIKEDLLCKFIASLSFFELNDIGDASKIVSKPWTVSGLDSETQSDGYNCGVFVIFNVFRVLTLYEKDEDIRMINADYRRCVYHLEVADAIKFQRKTKKHCNNCSTEVDVDDNADINISEFICSDCMIIIRNENPNAFQQVLNASSDDSVVQENDEPDEHKNNIGEYDAFKDNVNKKSNKSYLAGVSWDSSKNLWKRFTSIKFDKQDLDLCYMDQEAHTAKKGKLQRGGWFDKLSYTTILRDKMNDFDRNCVYCVETQTHSKSSIIIYGYCGHFRPEKPCRLFKYVASLPSVDGITFEVYVNETEVNHAKMLTEPCKGLAMQRLKEKTLQMPPKQIFHSQCDAVPDSVETTKNCTHVQSLPYIRWVKHKAMAENDLNRDSIVAACMKFDNSNAKFIKSVDVRPGIGIKMYSDAGHAVVHREIKINGIKPLAHYDGTGGLFEYLDEFPKKDIQLLLLVIRVKNCPQDLDRNSVTIPVYYHITSDLHAITLQNGLECFYHSYMKKYPEDGIPFRGVVTDNSKGNIHALSMVFNKMNLGQYLDRMHCLEQQPLEDKRKLVQDICLIYFCDAHMTKKQYKLVDEAFKGIDSNLANIVKIIIAKMYNITNYAEFKKYWYNVCVFLLTDEFSSDYQQAYSHLKLNKLDIDKLPSEDELLDSSTYIDKQSDCQYKHSPFFNDVTKILRLAQQNVTFDSSQYESRLAFLETFSKRYLYLIPLWIPIFSDCVKDNPQLDKSVRKSNAAIEGKFSELKQYLETISLRIGRGRKRIIRVIDELEKDHFSSANVHKKQIPLSGLRKREFPSLEVNCSTPKKAKLAGNKRRAETFPTGSYDGLGDGDEDKINDFLFVEDTFKRRRKTAYSEMQDTKLASTHKTLFDIPFPSRPPKMEVKECIQTVHKSCSGTEDEASSIKDISLDGATLKRENVFYVNRAFKDPQYYSNLNDDVTLSVQIDFVGNTRFIPILVKDFKTLMNNNWLSDSIIDTALMLIVRQFNNLDIISLSVHDSCKLFMDSIEKVNMGKLHKFIENVLSHDIILVPMMNDERNHYLLVIIDLQNKKFFYFNSGAVLNELKLRSLLSSFKQCMNFYSSNGFINIDKTKWKSGGWKIEQPEIPKQKDNHSCGIFVIHYAEQFLKFLSEEFTSHMDFTCSSIDPQFKRVEIQRSILQNLFIDTSRCPICNRGDDISIPMHYCEFCNRWIHYICDGREEIKSSLPKERDYICKTCSVFFKGHTFGKKIHHEDRIITI